MTCLAQLQYLVRVSSAWNWDKRCIVSVSRSSCSAWSGLVGPLTDEAITAYAAKTINEEFYLDADAKVEQMFRDGDQVRIRYLDKSGQQQEISVDYVLAATTAVAPTSTNWISKRVVSCSITAASRSPIASHADQRAHLFIAGDASNQLPLLHEAADPGRIAGDNAGRFPDIRAGLRRSALSVVFSDPQIAMSLAARYES